MKNLKINFNFYDSDEENNFQRNFPSDYKLFQKYNSTDIDIPLEDFKTYFLFRHHADSTNTISFDYVKEKLRSQWGIFKEYYAYNMKLEKFYALRDDNCENNEISQSLGEAGALSITSKIFLGLTQADWNRIPKSKHKDFDYSHIASDGKRFIVVEAKGSIVEDNQKLSEISGHKKLIKEKKADPDFTKKYNRKNNLFFGAITSADKTNHLNIRIVDPPDENIEDDPTKYKLLTRLYYYYYISRIISPYTYITLLLANRIKVLESIKDYSALDRVPLLNGSFEKIRITDYFLKTKAGVKDNIVGNSFVIDENTLAFVGSNVNLLKILIEQNFNDILNYKIPEPKEKHEILRCKLPRYGYLTKYFIKEDSQLEKEDNNIYFKVHANITEASSGISYCIINKENLEYV